MRQIIAELQTTLDSVGIDKDGSFDDPSGGRYFKAHEIAIDLVKSLFAIKGARCWATTPQKSANPKDLNAAIACCLKQKTLSGLRPIYMKGLAAYWRRFARFIGAGADVGGITVEKVERFLESNHNPATRASNAGRLASLFSFCKRRGWISENPVDKLEKVRVNRKTPFIFTLEQCRILFDWTVENKSRYVPWLALSVFCGIRPEELGKLTWDKLDLDAGTVWIDSEVAKTRMRRLVHISANAIGWLRLGGDLPIMKTARRRWQRGARMALGLSHWPQDALRHTAASMMLARDQNASKVATELGNSPGILATHYIDLVKPGDAQRFWAICPREIITRARIQALIQGGDAELIRLCKLFEYEETEGFTLIEFKGDRCYFRNSLAALMKRVSELTGEPLYIVVRSMLANLLGPEAESANGY